jgi:hypothetical protein
VPRAVSGPQLTILNGQAFHLYSKLEIKNASGTWKDFSALAGKDYYVSARAQTDVDVPVWSLSASLKRDGEAATESLSPLRGDSTLNVDDALASAPAINAAREWRWSVAPVAVGAGVLAGDWVELCAGYLDKPDFTADPMTVEGRSVGARLMEQTIRVKRTYTGTLASVAQQIVTDNIPSPAPTLYVPVAPTFTVTDYTPYQVTVMDALVTLALSTGWMIRDVYDPGDSTMKTAILDPGRARVTADFTMAPTTYLTVDGASLDVANIKNYIEGETIDSETGGIITTFARDPASIAAFGGVERYMKFSEDATSPIDTFDELQNMVDQALSDLSTPKFDHVVTSTLFWPVEITDLIDFTGNAVHYDTTQRLAVFGITHELTAGHGTTTLTCRGTPAGAFMEWIRRQGAGPETPAIPPAPQIDFVVAEAHSYGAGDDGDYDGGLWVGGRFNAGMKEMGAYTEIADGPNFSVEQSGTTVAIPRFQRPEGTEGTDPNFQFLIRFTCRQSFYKRPTFVGYSDLGRPSKEVIWPVAVQAVDPAPVPADGTLASMSVVQGLLGDFAVTVTPATLEPTIGENWLVITRNGVTVFRLMVGTSLAPVTFLDTGLTPENSYQYEAFILNLGETWGVSGPKLRSVTSNPPVVTTPQFTVGPVARLIGGVVQVYIEGTTGVVGADRMAVVKSFDQTNTTTFGISSGLTPFIATDTDTAMKWYKLVAFSSTDPLVWGESPWRWWSGVPVTGSQGTDPPTFIDGTPKREMRGGENGTVAVPVLLFRWACSTSGAAQIQIQESSDNGLSDPWTDFWTEANLNGEYAALAVGLSPTWYRVAALTAAGAALAWSAGVEA